MRGDEFFSQVALHEPFSKMHPSIATFFKDYLSHEKAIIYGDRFVVNTQFPPYPSPAFENLAQHFGLIGESKVRRLYSVTLAVTNRCNYGCWHCYNAGRSQIDIPFAEMKKVTAQLRELNTVMLTLTGGEPLLRADLEKIAIQFGDRVCIMLNTTGSGLTAERARGLRASGIFGIGVSLDSADEDEHDRLRGKSGAFKVALKALETASKNGLYPYVVTVATHDLLLHGRFESFMNFVADHGAIEIHLLTPCPTGRLAGNSDALLTQNEKKQILAYQREVAQREDLPILSTFLYLESQEAFGCGAGLTHLYIDGSGEVCPCNFVPASFGNVTNEPLKAILERMAEHFQKPRTGCVGHVLNRHISGKRLPLDPESSSALCERYLPKEHSVPRFFKIRNDEQGSVGREELRTAYDGIHHYYDEFWLSEARKPVEELLKMLPDNFRRVFEAGCGTGFATCMIAEKIGQATCIIAADISEGMLSEAKKRIEAHNISGVNFNHGDALEILRREKDFDLIFSSWVLGYIPLKDFFASSEIRFQETGCLHLLSTNRILPMSTSESSGNSLLKIHLSLQGRSISISRGIRTM